MAFHTSDSDYVYSRKRLDNNAQGEYNSNNNVEGDATNGREEQLQGNVDHGRDGGRSAPQYAEKQMAGSASGIKMANRDSDEIGRHARGSGKNVLSTDSEGIQIDVSAAEKLYGTEIFKKMCT